MSNAARSRRILFMPALLLAMLATTGCQRRDDREALAGELTGGSPRRGEAAIRKYGCGSCHEIPGVPGADASVGPSLQGIAGRSYLAGMLTNSPQNMRTWIMHPQQVVPGNAMPDMGVTEPEARDIAAYLYTLR